MLGNEGKYDTMQKADYRRFDQILCFSNPITSDRHFQNVLPGGY